MERVLIAVLSCALLSTSGACAEGTPLARDVHECETQRVTACNRVESRLAALFVGGGDEAERALAGRLAAAAVEVLRRPSAGRVLDSRLRKCAANDLGECARVAGVLSGLFTGDDARLELSPEAPLAHALAERLLLAATSSNTRGMNAQE